MPNGRTRSAWIRRSTRRAMSTRAMRARPRARPALMIGSHIDTVRDAGRYDGNLGALAALAVVEQLAEARRTARLRRRHRRVRRRGRRALSHDHDRLARTRRARARRLPIAAGRRGDHAARCADEVRRRSRAHRGVARPRRSRPSSNCTSNRGRCWRRRIWRSERSARSTARRASPRPSKASRAMPAACRCGCARTRSPPARR